MRQYKKLGIYIHIPFCEKKCPYCDFYSLKYDSKSNLQNQYFMALQKEINTYKKDIKKANILVDTIYFGGGTPSIVDVKYIGSILKQIKSVFKHKDLETTLEVNPNTVDKDYLKALKKIGINRLSFGLQSGNDDELYILERSHLADDVRLAVELAKEAGFKNISVDLMLGLPDQTLDKVKNSLEFIKKLDIQHVSAYMLQIERNTKFDNPNIIKRLPTEDETAKIYLFVVDQLKQMGFYQYEISNFARKGLESRHNLKYWEREEYLGFGVAAHSFYNNKRYYSDNNIYKYIGYGKADDFIYNYDNDKNTINEYIMLKLRKSDGLCLNEMEMIFPKILINEFLSNLKKYENTKYILVDSQNIRLTTEGFLIYNTLVSDLMVDD